MRIKTLRILENSLGPPLCRVLLILKNFLSLWSDAFRLRLGRHTIRPLPRTQNILAIKFFGMGTILLAVPSLIELKKKNPGSRLILFTLLSNRELCEMLDCLDKVIYLDIRDPWSFFKSFGAALRDIKKDRCQLVLNLEFLTHFSAIVTLLVTLFDRQTTIVGFSSPYPWRKSLNTSNVCFDHTRHVIRIFAKAISSITKESFEPSWSCVQEALCKNMDAHFFQRLLDQHPRIKACSFFVVMNVNAGELSHERRWPMAYFSKIADDFIQLPDVALLLIGTEQDKEYVAEFQRTLPPSERVINLCGKTNLKELIGLLSRSDLVITNDGGPVHFAAAVGTSTVSFFGPETPYLYGPIGDQDKHAVFYHDHICSPCLTIYNAKMVNCRNNVCLQKIKPQDVIKVIHERFLTQAHLVSKGSP